MDPAKLQTVRLKGEMLRLASEIVGRDGGTMGTYMLVREDLECGSAEEQVLMLRMQLTTLNAILMPNPGAKRKRAPTTSESGGSAGQRPRPDKSGRPEAAPPSKLEQRLLVRLRNSGINFGFDIFQNFSRSEIESETWT
jgi:hypothetical protein